MTLLALIEDDPHIRNSLAQALTNRGHNVITAKNGLSGFKIVIDRHPDVVLLDLGLPDLDGLEVLTMLRAKSPVPVIVTTARDQDGDIIKALEMGADDYLVKPFSIDHLEARLRAVLRRTQPGIPQTVNIGQLCIDPSLRIASLKGIELDLSRKEFELLAYLGARRDRVVSKRELLSAIWNQPWGGADKTIDVHLSWLRRKLGETANAPRYLRVIRGVGIQLVDPKT